MMLKASMIRKISVFALAMTLTLFAIAFAGVGGGIEAKEKVDIVPLAKWTLVFLAGLGTVFGASLAIAAKRFAVQIDPRVEKVKDVLAHAHCGACGYAGCEQYAEAVVNNPDVSPNLCIPAGAKGAEAVALITGKKAEVRSPGSRGSCARVAGPSRSSGSSTKGCRTAGPPYSRAAETRHAGTAVSATGPVPGSVLLTQ
jgi:hypothetical protein